MRHAVYIPREFEGWWKEREDPNPNLNYRFDLGDYGLNEAQIIYFLLYLCNPLSLESLLAGHLSTHHRRS